MEGRGRKEVSHVLCHFVLCLVCICLLRCDCGRNAVINNVVLFVELKEKMKMRQGDCPVSAIC